MTVFEHLAAILSPLLAIAIIGLVHEPLTPLQSAVVFIFGVSIAYYSKYRQLQQPEE